MESSPNDTKYAKFFIITGTFIIIMIALFIIFKAELTPFFNNLLDILLNERDATDFDPDSGDVIPPTPKINL